MQNVIECFNEHDIIKSNDNITNTLCINNNSFSEQSPNKVTRSNNELSTDDTNSLNINIYRYKFTNEFVNELYTFAKIHQYDHRKDFKDAWETWIEEQEDIVNSEIRRLTNLNYEGDIIDKMFKSARYYFRKKSTEKKAPKQRTPYKSVQKPLLDAMDLHIKSQIKEKDYKPSTGFDEFCKMNKDLLREEVNYLCKNGIVDSEMIKSKIKKTYKNRYFLVICK
jgi:hypothetical protein